jgi:hypothetical protein
LADASGTSTTIKIRVEFILDPVHFCDSAVGARAKAMNAMAKPPWNAGWHESCFYVAFKHHLTPLERHE